MVGHFVNYCDDSVAEVLKQVKTGNKKTNQERVWMWDQKKHSRNGSIGIDGIEQTRLERK